MRPAIEEICRQVADHFGYVTVEDIAGRVRSKSVADARAIAMWLARLKYGLSYPELGREFGRDHTTCISLVRKVEAASGILYLSARTLETQVVHRHALFGTGTVGAAE